MQQPRNDVNFGPSHAGAYPASSRRFPGGCLLGGCLAVMALMIAGGVGTGVGFYWLYKGQLAKYTSEEAKVLPTVEMSPEELAAIEERIETFQDDLDEGETPEQLVLTADDINGLISGNEDLRGKVFVRIEEGVITAEVSIPTDSLPGGKGRFFNGSVTAEVELKGGVLVVTVAEAEVNGNPVPEPIMQGLRQENLAKDLHKDPEVADSLARFETIIVEGDRIVLTVREQESDDPTENDPADGNELQTESGPEEESGSAAETPDESVAEGAEPETIDSGPERLSSPFCD